jgi:hypothetical protein
MGRRVSFAISHDLVSKGELIRSKGRQAWDNFPKDQIVKDGKRAYITRHAFEDNLWLADSTRSGITGY